MNEIQIELKFDRNVFEEIYFKCNKGNIFLSPKSKNYFLSLAILSLALIFISIYCVRTDRFIFILIVLFLLWIAAAFQFIRAANTIIQWKKSVNSYLNQLSKYQFYKLILTETVFSVIFENNEVIEKWSAINHVSICEEFIDLKASQTYLFPRKSMSNADYDLFKVFVSQKVKHS